MLTLHILRPSANNLSVRAFLRAAGLEFQEVDAWGHTREAAFLAKCPAHLTPLLEDPDLPHALWESGAILRYLADREDLEDFYPRDLARRARLDSALFYHTGTLYPLVARATYPRLGYPLYPGEVGASEAGPEEKEKARKAAEAALAEPLSVFESFYLGKSDFVGGAHPSIADLRLAATLEFLAVLDRKAPWIAPYIARVEKALGSAWQEPAADIRGYIASLETRSA